MSLIALTVSLAAFQAAVVGDPNDAVMLGALTTLSSQPTLFLQLNGSISFHNKTTPLVTNLYWSSSTVGANQLLQVDVESYSNGTLVKRIVGDGDTLWSYDLSTRQYSATSYGGSPGLARPTSYASDLLNDLNWAASGQDGYLAKLLRQIYNPVGATYTSWMPGILSAELLPGGGVTDPIATNVVYYPSATNNYYAYNSSPKRTIVFEITQGVTSGVSSQPTAGLANVYFNQAETIMRSTRLIQWVITPYTGFTFSTSNFAPYTGKQIQGWRMVVAPKPVGNN